MKWFSALGLPIFFAIGCATPIGAVPIAIKVVIVTTFEDDYQNPNATGLTDGEASRWIRGMHLDQVKSLPAGFRPVRLNDDGVLEIMTGMTTAKAATSTMALGLDSRFDLTKAYWLLAGIAGIDPQQASQGSAAWAEWVVDGDIANRVDSREIPPAWPDGHIPWNKTTPFEAPGADIGEVYHLNPGLVKWAFELTRSTPIPDSAKMRAFRARFSNFPAAQRPPFVLIGDNLASATYWQGTLETQWARRWVKLYTHGLGTFTTSSCEDSGFMQAMTLLAKAGRVDLRRVLILRTASDYCVPGSGVTSAESLQYGTDKAYMADQEAFQSAYVVGRVVVDKLVNGWQKYGEQIP
jgi:purine nucleoside permease